MIHPTASISPEAELADDVTVGAYAVIDGPAKIGSGCTLAHAAQIIGDVTLGTGTHVGHAAVVGAPPQDLGFDLSTPSSVTVGAGTTIREHVTVHRSKLENGATRIGDNNYLMVGAHVAHDCTLGDDNIIANAALLAGHVTVGDGCFIGGGSVFHQFLRIGSRCITQGHSSIGKDIPPFTMVSGYDILNGLNSIGLRRAGFSPEERTDLKRLFHLLFRSERSLSEAVTAAEAQEWLPAATELLDFVRTPTKRGICLREG